MDNELETTWMEAVAVQFEVLSCNMPRGTEEIHGIPQSVSLYRLSIQRKAEIGVISSSQCKLLLILALLFHPQIFFRICWHCAPEIKVF